MYLPSSTRSSVVGNRRRETNPFKEEEQDDTSPSSLSSSSFAGERDPVMVVEVEGVIEGTYVVSGPGTVMLS